METSHRETVSQLLAAAAREHERLLAELPPELAASLPVDAQGLTRAIDHLADAAGLTTHERLDLVRPHALNPAVMHARVYGRAPLSAGTVIGSFVDGARVRADALTVLADTIGGEPLGAAVRELFVGHPPPSGETGDAAVAALRATYAAQERAAVLIAAGLDAQ